MSINQHSEIVEKRLRIGNWEGDIVHGQNASLVTLVERASRYTLCQRVWSKNKEEVAATINQLFSSIKGRKNTQTLDNGGEFAAYSRITKRHGIALYFADPYKSWQRGANENTNGRLRRIWPKGFDMVKLSKNR